MATVKSIPRRRVTAVQAGQLRVEYAPEPAGARRRVAVGGADGSSGQASTYFTNVAERTDLRFVSSGAAVLNCALGGGYVLGRIVNIVGDRSAGKTLLAIEACANFHNQYPTGHIRYKEAESAFDEKYAEALGMPVGIVDFKGRSIDPKDEAKYAELAEDLKDAASTREKEAVEKAMRKLAAKGVGKAQNTVEALFDDIEWTLDTHVGKPILYVLDSLDALSDEAEQGREIGDGSYGGSKPKKMGEMFRRLVERIEQSQMLLVIISQLRDKIGVTFGEKQTRSGGRALDFYASHIIWLSELGKLAKTIDKVQRVIGVNVRARVKKNKVGLPFRECSYPILFGYGVDDLTANVEWLIEVGCDKRLDEVGLSKAGYKISLPNIRNKGGETARDMRAKLTAIVWQEWQRIESGFLPRARKY